MDLVEILGSLKESGVLSDLLLSNPLNLIAVLSFLSLAMLFAYKTNKASNKQIKTFEDMVITLEAIKVREEERNNNYNTNMNILRNDVSELSNKVDRMTQELIRMTSKPCVSSVSTYVTDSLTNIL